MAILKELNHDQGLTIVLVTHEPDIAAVADRVLTFRDGEVVADEITTNSEKMRTAPRFEENTGP
jgi:macrolide transport system ATP-binding/permease protein